MIEVVVLQKGNTVAGTECHRNVPIIAGIFESTPYTNTLGLVIETMAKHLFALLNGCSPFSIFGMIVSSIGWDVSSIRGIFGYFASSVNVGHSC